MVWSLTRRGLLIRSLVAGLALVVSLSCLPPTRSALAQASKAKKAANEAEKVAGKVAKVERKGKAVTLTIERDDGGKSEEILVTPKLAFTVTGKGDAAFLQPKVAVSSEKLFMANNELFGKEFNVYLGATPATFVKKDPNAAEVYSACGIITAADAQTLSVNFGAGVGVRKINFEQGAEVTIKVISTDPGLVEEGATVELEGNTRGKNFLPTKLAVTLADPLTADEVLGDKKSGKTTKSATATQNKSSSKTPKTAKSNDDTPAGTPAGTASDPFGVLNKKDAKGTKAPDKKDGDKKEKETEKKGEG